jgi:arylsulfatase
LDETLDFGQDTGTPVVEEYAAAMPFAFNGTLERFVIRLGETRLGAGDALELDEQIRRAASVGE